MALSGIIETASGDLLRWGEGTTFTPGAGEEAAPTPLPANPIRRQPGKPGNFHSWNGNSYDLVAQPKGLVQFIIPVWLLCEKASITTNSTTYLESGIETVLDLDTISQNGIYVLSGILAATITADKVNTTAFADVTEDVGGPIAGSEVSEETDVYTKKTSPEFDLPNTGLREFQLRIKRQGGSGQPDVLCRAATLHILGRGA